MEKGVTNGTTDTTFGPNGTCTSAHVVTFLWRANGKSAANTDGTNYYDEAVAWANSQKLLDGTAVPFAPDNLSPRADIVTYLYRVLRKYSLIPLYKAVRIPLKRDARCIYLPENSLTWRGTQ